MGTLEHIQILKFIIFGLIVFINLLYLFDMSITTNGTSNLGSGVSTAFEVARIIHICLTILCMGVVAIERYPVVTN